MLTGYRSLSPRSTSPFSSVRAKKLSPLPKVNNFFGAAATTPTGAAAVAGGTVAAAEGGATKHYYLNRAETTKLPPRRTDLDGTRVKLPTQKQSDF